MAVNPVPDNNLVSKFRTNSVSIRDAAKGCLISKRVANLSESYLETFEITLALFANFAEDQGWPLIADVTADRIEDYLAYVRSRPRWFGQPGRPKKGKTQHQPQRPPSASYVASLHTRIKMFFNWLVERGHVADNPFRLVPKPKVEDRVIPTVSESQVSDLFRLLDPANATTKSEWFRALRDRALLFILWDTPGRRKEIATLTDDSVDLDSGVILVMGKGRKERWMPIGASVQEALWAYLQAKDQLRFKAPRNCGCRMLASRCWQRGYPRC